MLPLHPAKRATFLEKLTRIERRKKKKYFSKKLFKTLARTKRIATFAPAKRKNGETKKEEHVPRHIELTAVLREILKQI